MRLKPEVLAVKVEGMNIMDLCAINIQEAYDFVMGLKTEWTEKAA